MSGKLNKRGLLQSLHIPEVRWNRGCGSGIGLSGHKNEYQAGVNVNNFVEDRAAESARAHPLGFGGQAYLQSEYQGTYLRSPEEIAAALAERARPAVPDIAAQDKDQRILFEHGPSCGGAPQPDAMATLNSLTYSPPEFGKKRVTQELWIGDKAHDRQVTLSRVATELQTSKARQWAEEDGAACFSTSQRSAQMAAALQSVACAGGTKRGSLKRDATAEGGQRAQVGRRPRGEFADECDKSFRKMDFRRPILYTVELRPKDPEAGL